MLLCGSTIQALTRHTNVTNHRQEGNASCTQIGFARLFRVVPPNLDRLFAFAAHAPELAASALSQTLGWPQFGQRHA